MDLGDMELVDIDFSCLNESDDELKIENNSDEDDDDDDEVVVEDEEDEDITDNKESVILNVFDMDVEFSDDNDDDEQKLVIASTSKQMPEKAVSDDKTLESCLISNQMYQDCIFDALSYLDSALCANKEKQEQLQIKLNKSIKDAQGVVPNSCCPIRSSKFLASPYFRDEKNFYCTKNEDFFIKKANGELDNYTFAPLNWVKSDKEILLTAVRSNARKHLIEPLLMRKQNLMRRLAEMKTHVKTLDKPDEEKQVEMLRIEDEMSTKINLVDEDLNKVTTMEDKKLFSPEVQRRDIDWIYISQKYFCHKRNDESCRLIWDNLISPIFNQDPWTPEEERELMDIAREYEFHDWDSIAEALGTGRSAFMCFQHFQRELKMEKKDKLVWTPEQNKILLERINKCTINGNILWNKVLSNYEGGVAKKIRSHYKYFLDPKINRSRFTIEEDLVIYLCSLKYEKQFINYCNYLPERSSVQIRMRFMNSIIERRNLKFSDVEDLKIARCAMEHKSNWAGIKDKIPGRTPAQISSRFKIIIKHIPDVLDKIDDPKFIMPYITSCVSCSYYKRHRMFRNYINDRLHYFQTTHPAIEKMECRPLQKFYPKSFDPFDQEAFIKPNLKPEELNFLLNDASEIFRKSINELERRGRPKNHKVVKDIDEEIDQILLESFAIANFSHRGVDIHSMLGGKKAAEYNACCNVLHKAMGVKRVLPLSETPNDRDVDQEEEVTFIGKKIFRKQEEQLVEATEGLHKTCIKELPVNESNPKYPTTILPPNKATLEAFQSIIKDRKRLADMASNTEIPQMALAILNKSSKCPDCLKKSSSEENFPSTSHIKVEYGCESLEVKCQNCEFLKVYKEGYNVLRRRFISMFLWPGLLSITKPPEGDLATQEELKGIKQTHPKFQEKLLTKTGKVKRKRLLGSRANLKARRERLKERLELKAKEKELKNVVSEENGEIYMGPSTSNSGAVFHGNGADDQKHGIVVQENSEVVQKNSAIDQVNGALVQESGASSLTMDNRCKPYKKRNYYAQGIEPTRRSKRKK